MYFIIYYIIAFAIYLAWVSTPTSLIIFCIFFFTGLIIALSSLIKAFKEE
jgi:hypothetical protein